MPPYQHLYREQVYAAGSAQDLGNGSYLGEVTPRVAGSYDVFVSLNDQVTRASCVWFEGRSRAAASGQNHYSLDSARQDVIVLFLSNEKREHPGISPVQDDVRFQAYSHGTLFHVSHSSLVP